MSAWDPIGIRPRVIADLRSFIERHHRYLTGRVLDFGAGKPGTCREPQPYRDLVIGEYLPYDLGDPMPRGPFDTVLCTQVMQFLRLPYAWFMHVRPGGVLVATIPTNWDEVEDTDLHRFTAAGMRRALADRGFEVLHHEPLTTIGPKFHMNHGFVARRRLS